MAIYFSKKPHPEANFADWMPIVYSINVPSHDPVDTGLLDFDGHPIMKSKDPIGFVWGGAAETKNLK
jgi:hypothetical protein